MNRPHPASAHAGYGRLYRLAAGLLSGLLVCLMLTGCGYVWRGQEGSLSENSVLGNGSKTLKIKSVEQTSLYPWLTYQVRSLVRVDINARNLAKWVDDGQADYTLTVRIPSFKVRSYGQYRSASQLYTATISIEFIVYDGKMHPVDSNEISFMLAGRNAFSTAFKEAGPKILEPVYDVEVSVPADYLGDVMSDLQGRRAIIMGMNSEKGYEKLLAKVPLKEMSSYSTSLSSITGGRASFTMKFSSYELVPSDVQDKLLKAYEATQAED